MRNRNEQACGLTELTAAEVAAVAGGTPWVIFRSLDHQGSLDDLPTPEGFRAWSWKQFFRLYVQPRSARAVLAPGQAGLEAKSRFGSWLGAREG